MANQCLTTSRLLKRVLAWSLSLQVLATLMASKLSSCMISLAQVMITRTCTPRFLWVLTRCWADRNSSRWSTLRGQSIRATFITSRWTREWRLQWASTAQERTASRSRYPRRQRLQGLNATITSSTLTSPLIVPQQIRCSTRQRTEVVILTLLGEHHNDSETRDRSRLADMTRACSSNQSTLRLFKFSSLRICNLLRSSKLSNRSNSQTGRRPARNEAQTSLLSSERLSMESRHYRRKTTAQCSFIKEKQGLVLRQLQRSKGLWSRSMSWQGRQIRI